MYVRGGVCCCNRWKSRTELRITSDLEYCCSLGVSERSVLVPRKRSIDADLMILGGWVQHPGTLCKSWDVMNVSPTAADGVLNSKSTSILQLSMSGPPISDLIG